LLKIFTTQLTGVFKKIADEEELQFEDASRLLAQSILSESTIYFYGVKEFEAITLEAVHGEDVLKNTMNLKDLSTYGELTPQDIVVIATRYSTDEVAVNLARKLAEQGVTTVGISSVLDGELSLAEVVEVHIDLKEINRLVPLTFERRIGYPIIMAGLYAYFGLYLTTSEILSEYAGEEEY
jgi:uncharacterized phosphosugar-binding protein